MVLVFILLFAFSDLAIEIEIESILITIIIIMSFRQTHCSSFARVLSFNILFFACFSRPAGSFLPAGCLLVLLTHYSDFSPASAPFPVGLILSGADSFARSTRTGTHSAIDRQSHIFGHQFLHCSFPSTDKFHSLCSLASHSLSCPPPILIPTDQNR